MDKNLIKIDNKLNHFIEILSYGFLIFLYIRLFIHNHDLLVNAILGLSGAFIFILNLISQKSIKKIELITLIFLFVGISINVIFIKNASIYEPLWIFCYFGIYLSLNNGLLNSKIILFITLLFYSIIIIFSLLGADPNEIFYSESRNGISSVGIFLLSLYYISAYIKKEHIYLFPAIILFYCCIYSIGRSAFLVSSIWVFCLIILNPSENKIKFNLKFLIIVVIYILMWMLLIELKSLQEISSSSTLQNIHTEFNPSNSKVINHFEYTGTSSARFVFWSNYLAYIFRNPKALIFGASRLNHPELYPYAENLHNVFFMLHSKTGILGLIPILFLSFRAFIKLIKEKNLTMLFVFCMFGLRAMFDWVGFFAAYDILFYFILFNFNKDIFSDKDAFNFSSLECLLSKRNKYHENT